MEGNNRLAPASSSTCPSSGPVLTAIVNIPAAAPAWTPPKYATSEELLLATKPELAVISVGYNTYGHPAPETLERLAAAGCAIYRTDWSGTVTITAK